eukprot:scaffold487_cov344-Prasinococcus_capsulatus_cf.AAC.17
MKTRLLYDLLVAPQRWLPVQLVEQRVQNDIEANLNAVRASAIERFSVNPNAYCKLQLTSEGTVEKGEVGQEKSGEIYDAMEEPASGFLNTIEQLLRPSGSRRT